MSSRTINRKIRRLRMERKTIRIMIALYCRDKHGGSNTLCPECQELIDYAELRLDRCPYGNEKPTCAHCPIHCYKPERRDQIREVMRYSGPRMLLKHPILAIRHQLAGRRPVPNLKDLQSENK